MCICADGKNFPTDLYMLEGLTSLVGPSYSVRHLESMEDEAALCAALDSDVAVVVLTHVSYHTGRMLNMQHLTSFVHARSAQPV